MKRTVQYLSRAQKVFITVATAIRGQFICTKLDALNARSHPVLHKIPMR